MSTGIIAEYNPFHNGHLFHINETRRKLDTPIIVALSTNFTQRGLPAFCDKWARARMALENGANLVVEIPTFFSCGSATIFAQAVDILNALNVSHISFGVEDLDMLEKTSLILAQEPPAFKQTLRFELSRGASFAKAISLALEGELSGSGEFASKPNNSLALSYLSHIKKMGYQIMPLPIKREGPGHHKSASEIRTIFTQYSDSENFDIFDISDMPLSTKKILAECKSQNKICADNEKMWDFFRFALLSENREKLKNIDGVNEGLEGLFFKNINRAASLTDFVGRCVCARYTRGRIQRQIIKILLDIDTWTGMAIRRAGPRYVRVLGYDEIGKKILRASRKSQLQIITKLSSVRDKIGINIAEIEFRAAKLWKLIVAETGGEEKPISFDRSICKL